MDKMKGEITTISDMFFYDDTLQSMAVNNIVYKDTKKEMEYLKNLDHKIRKTLAHYSFDYEMQLLTTNGLRYSTDAKKLKDLELYTNELWYYKAVNSPDPLYWLSSLRTRYSTREDPNYFSLLRFFRTESSEIAGMIMINIPERFLYDTYQNLTSDNGNVYVVDTEGQIISHTTESMIGHYFYKMPVFYELFGDSNSATIQKSGVPYLFSKYSTDDSSWIVVEEIPMSSILHPLYRIERSIILIALLVCVISILAAAWVSYAISRPLTEVYTAMDEAQGGNFNVVFPRKGFAETQWIADACENFVVRIVSLLNDIKKKEHTKRVTELHFLQMQINPHFMHNTLFSIKCMVDMGRSEEACRMIDALNSMLKNILNCKQQLVSVQEEVDTLKQYTYILQQRYTNSFTFKFLIDDECKDQLILRFILQPIIENAVFHGFSNNRKDGVIVIRIKSKGQYLLLKVTDNGKGMPKEQVDSLTTPDTKDHRHIGLKNIASRLELHYQSDYKFEISSREGKGTTISITLPKYTI
ncbi:sensor histidine kinase [Faecalicatena sp. AGMB00832]|uniref:Sensor histidine kinase n=2 Tax=Lachnospiraceae TaxID=186803 RepID=A0ABS6DAU9_9FIRM|nr:sensor histidine kinase [Faecalicatena faecalis]MCI6835885.1 sensor histidine kinase [Phocaeicola vulgatus]